MALLKSTGTKRNVASYLSVLIELVSQVPFLAPLIPILQLIAGLFGGSGITHAALASTVTLNISGTFAALFAGLSAAASYLPALTPYAELFKSLATVFGAYTTGKRFAK